MRPVGFSYRFSGAIVRKPGRSVIDGLRATDRGAPDFERFQQQHDGYVRALERAEVEVTVLPALERFPDSVFVEDAALCLPEGTIMMRPGAPSRTAEADVLGDELTELGHRIVRCTSEGYIDGGDILTTETAILVGLSARTDLAGLEWLRSVLEPWGYTVRAVRTPKDVLHFKSDCCLLDSHTVLATERLMGATCFSSLRVLKVPSAEEPAANSIRVNDSVLVPAGFPRTADLLARSGYAVTTVDVTQAGLLDGGLSCMSLRLPRA